MKKLLTLAAAIAFSFASFAQTTSGDKMSKDQGTKTATKKDCYKMKDGKMMEMKDGKWAAMTMDATLKNGTMVMTNGTVKMTDGKTSQLKEGEGIDVDGKMMMKPAKKDDGKMGK